MADSGIEASTQSDSETETTEEEIEPKFKYERIANNLQFILQVDVVTCCAMHPKFLIVGTFLGRVYLCDHQGNSVNSNLKDKHNEIAHSVAVNQIDIDAKGEYIATCSDDGRVNIIGLFSSENNQRISLGKSVKAVALDPDPKTVAGKKFIVGDDKLTMYDKTFIGKLKSTVLASAEGAVLSVCWNGTFVAWASCVGVRVHDLNEKCSLGLMKWEEPPNARLENFRCNFRWSNPNTLLIGWVDTIRICVIRKRNAIEAHSGNLPGLIVDPISTFQTAFYICGLAPLMASQLVVLGYPKEKDVDRKALRPVLCVMDYKLNSSEEICTDSLSIRGFKEYTVNDYNLCCIMEEHRFCITAPKDIVVASPYDTDDRVKWLTDHRKFKEAMNVITTLGGSVPLIQVAKSYIDDLLTHRKFDEAAELCKRVLGNDKLLWEEQVFKFVKPQQLRSVSAYLPTSDSCKLAPHVYEMVLFEYLKCDAQGFLNLIKEWPPHLYNCLAVLNAIRDNCRPENLKELLEASGILYTHQKDYENALAIYLKLQNKDVFKLITDHNLYKVIHKMIIPLIQIDRAKAFEILLDRSKIPPEIVVEQLEQNQELLYMYLVALDKVDRRGTFHEKLVNLYAKFEPEKLLAFLRRSDHYNIQNALDVCKRNLFYPEIVYLLSKMGNNIEALNIIIKQKKDIEMAIEFCKEHEDSDLWNVIIDESIENPDITIKLLDGMMGYVNPVAVVNKIKLGQKIPGLRRAVIKMLWDYRLQEKIQQSIYDIQLADYFQKHATLVSEQNRGHSFSYDNLCQKCQRPVISNENIPRKNLIAFNCGHVYHLPCMEGVDYCIECKADEEEEEEEETQEEDK